MNAAVQPVAANDVPHTAITLAERARRAIITSTAQTEEALRALAGKHTSIIAITGADGRADCHSAYMELKNTRIAIEKAGKDARDDATKFSKAVIDEEKRLVAIIDKEEERLKVIRDAWDAEQERIRLAEADKERKRVEAHQAVITSIRETPSKMVGLGSAAIQKHIDMLAELRLDGLEEFQVEATTTRANVRAQLVAILAGVVKNEQDAAELERLRQAETARLAKEAEERAQAEAIAKAEADARAKTEATERAAREKEEAARRAELERVEREQKDRLAAEQAAHQKRLDDEAAAARAEREAEARRQAEERAAIERQRKDLEEKERQRQEALAAVDSKIAESAGRFYAVLVQLRDMLIPGSAEAELVETALQEAGLDK